MPIAGELNLGPPGPTATNARELELLAASRAVEAARQLREQPESVQVAARAAVRARLRKKGTTIAEAWHAHSEALAGRQHNHHAAAAWRAAIAAVAALAITAP